MKKFLYIILLIALQGIGFAQKITTDNPYGFSYWANPITPCVAIDQSTAPITPYIDYCLQFNRDGHSRQFMIWKASAITGLPWNTTDSFRIEMRLSICKAGTQKIWGRRTVAGFWDIWYNDSYALGLQFAATGINGGARLLYTLAAGDTTFHNYIIIFDKTDSTLKTYVDGVLETTNTGVYWTQYVATVTYPMTFGTDQFVVVPPNNIYYFGGYADNLYMKINNEEIDYYDCNMGAGAFLIGHNSYYVNDRISLDGTGYYSTNSQNVQLGYVPTSTYGGDTTCPVWFPIDGTRKNGTSKWSTLGSGLQFYNESADNYWGENYCLGGDTITYNGERLLVIGGNVNRLNGGIDTCRYIAKYNGSTWSRLGLGFNRLVVSVRNINDTSITAGGQFTDLFDGTDMSKISTYNFTRGTWAAYGSGLNDDCYMIYEWRDTMYAGGPFTTANGVTCRYIAQWTGTTFKEPAGGLPSIAWGMVKYNNKLAVSGSFGVYLWDGMQWDTLAALADGTIVSGLCVDASGYLWAAGSFPDLGGATGCNGLAKYNGSTWSAGGGTGIGGYSGYPGIHGEGIDMKLINGKLYLAGLFRTINGSTCHNAAVYNGADWCPLGYGPDLKTEEIINYQGNVVYIGDILSSDGIPMNNIGIYTP